MHSMSKHATERVETVKLLQLLNRGNEKPGQIILRALRCLRDHELGEPPTLSSAALREQEQP